MTQALPFLRHARSLLVLPLILAACDQKPAAQTDAPPEPGVLAATRNGPVGAPEGSCWGKTVSPAVVQTVTRQEQIKPAVVNPDGTIGVLPEFKSTTRQEIITPRVDNWFETPCTETLSPQFISSLQRALFARGLYAGAITGILNADTRAAVQRLQRTEGLDSPVLSLETARMLGLVAVPRSPT